MTLPTRSQLLHDAVALINGGGTGLLTTGEGTEERVWIGTAVRAMSGRTLVALLPPDHPIHRAVERCPQVRWHFQDESGEHQLAVEGAATVMPGPLWERTQGAADSAAGFAALVTRIGAVAHVRPRENLSCRIAFESAETPLFGPPARATHPGSRHGSAILSA